jgi:glycosyltransferase involved in cell wall biosynthesis
MRILLVSYFFAPANSIGALRVTRLASFLIRAGHDVRVLAVADAGGPRTLDCDLPDAYVARTPQLEINWLPRRLAMLRHAARSGREAPHSDDPSIAPAGARSSLSDRILHQAAALYTNALNWPDARAGWLPHAWAAGRKLFRTWRPDLVYASSPPPTCLLVAKLLAARCNVPWIAEFRDRWADDPYYPKPAWRQALEARLERRIVGSAGAIVTVSEPWAEHYAQTHRKPTLVVHNGFEPADYVGRESSGALESPCLEIVYTGGIYPGRRDPTPLFQALASMPEASAAVRLLFYGTNPAHFLPLAMQQGVGDVVIAHPHIPHAQAAEVQQRADVLLVMQWNDPRDQGHIPAKLFEYLGARRPILGIGLEGGVPARIISERAAGCFTNDPTRIAAQLTTWLATKRRLGRVPPLSVKAAAGFTRAEQFARLEQFIGEMVR